MKERLGAPLDRGAAAILGTALLVRLVFCFLVYPPIAQRLGWTGIDDGHDQLAASLLRGDGFRFAPGLPPNVTTPPGYAFLLAALYAVTGVALDENWRIWITHSLLDVATTALVMAIAARMFGERRPALAAGILYALYPQMLAYCARPYGEVLATFLLATGTWLAVEFVAAGDRRDVGETAGGGAASRRARAIALTAGLAGVFFGLAALVKEKALLFPPVLAAALAWRWRRSLRTRWAPIGLLVAGALLAVGPWLARGYQVTGKLMPVTSRTGRAVHWGLVSDYARPDVDAGQVPAPGTPDTAKWAIIYPPAPEGDSTMSEARSRLERDDALLASSLRLVRERPGAFVRSALTKFLAFWYWGQPRVIWVNFATQIPLLVLAVWGMALARRRGGAMLVPVLLILYFAGIHTLLVARMRYSLPVMPYVIVFAGYTLHRMTERGPTRPSPAVSP